VTPCIGRTLADRHDFYCQRIVGAIPASNSFAGRIPENGEIARITRVGAGGRDRNAERGTEIA
jgi:hypothetical protein